MNKRLALTLLIILHVLAMLTAIGTSIQNEYHDATKFNRTYTFDVERGNQRFTHKLYAFVPPSLYDYYSNATHLVKSERDYAKFVTPNVFTTIAENLRKVAPNRSNSDEDFANYVLAVVRQIPYSISDRKYPVEAIVENSGDCDVSSFLAASIMKAGGLDIVLLVYRKLPGSHMNIGVYLPYEPTYTQEIDPLGFEYNNKTYWVAECTPTGNWKIGHQPESFVDIEPTIIPLENKEETTPGLVSSSLNNPLTPSYISINLSLKDANATDREKPILISGYISPPYPGRKVVLFVSQDRTSGKIFQTKTDSDGKYSLTWNVTSTGKYYIRTNLIPFSNYAGSDSDLMTFFAGSHPTWVEEESHNYERSFDEPDYKTSSGKKVEILKSNLEGENISLSGKFMILKGEQTITNSEQTITIPEREHSIKIWRRQRIILVIPEQTVFSRETQTRNQFGFILQNTNKNYSANIRLMSDSDLTQIEEQNNETNLTLMNASANIKENVWHNVVVKASGGEVTVELLDENCTLLNNLAVKENATGNGEYGILISCTPDTFVAFKNLKVENIDQTLNESNSNIQLHERELELLAPCIILLTLLGTVSAAKTYLRKETIGIFNKN